MCALGLIATGCIIRSFGELRDEGTCRKLSSWLFFAKTPDDAAKGVNPGFKGGYPFFKGGYLGY